MGVSEWALAIRSNADWRAVKQLVDAHNQRHISRNETGEALVLQCAMRFRGVVYACLRSNNTAGSGESLTSAFIRKHAPVSLQTATLWPTSKPNGWFACTDKLWAQTVPASSVPDDVPGLPAS